MGEAPRMTGLAESALNADRKIVLVNINGVDMPFYLSTGLSNKYGVLSGRWYPFWGLDPDGWFNKTNEDDINEYYGSKVLRDVAAALDGKFGDLRGLAKGKVVAKRYKDNPEQFESIRSQVNRDMGKPLLGGRARSDYNEARTGGAAGMDAFRKRISGIIKKMEGRG